MEHTRIWKEQCEEGYPGRLSFFQVTSGEGILFPSKTYIIKWKIFEKIIPNYEPYQPLSAIFHFILTKKFPMKKELLQESGFFNFRIK